MIGRRTILLIGSAAALARPARLAADSPDAGRLAFRLVRDGSVIGSHILDFTPADNGFDIRIAVDIAVGLGPIALFRYTLRGLEQWRDGKVVHIETMTNDDGDLETVHGIRDSAGFWIQGSKAPTPYLAPATALPATHWNIAELQGSWINIEDGRLMKTIVAPRGMDTVKLADGNAIQARHYALSGDVNLDIWYDEQDRWCALTFVAHDGSLVRYERL